MWRKSYDIDIVVSVNIISLLSPFIVCVVEQNIDTYHLVGGANVKNVPKP